MVTSQSRTLEFLIPSYKRPDTVIRAMQSVAFQVEALGLSDRVRITVVDDCSPNIAETEMLEAVSQFRHFVTFSQNKVNKGMSLNIRDMVANSSASFCTVLTDDDRLQPNSLKQIIETIDTFGNRKNSPVIGSFFVPRYSYLEDQSLGCIVCDPFEENKIIKPSPMSSIRYLDNGFILTGLFFRPELINFRLWDNNIENGYFPVIYFADLLLNYECFFIKENWFVHTVLNQCHWDSWGKTEQARSSKLYRDYMEAVALSSQIALSRVPNILQRICLRGQEFLQYRNHMLVVLLQLDDENRIVGDLTSSQWPYRLAVIYFYVIRPIQSWLVILFYQAKRMGKLVIKPPVKLV